MAYTKTTWVNNQPPAINETNLNKIETGIYDAHIGDIYDDALSSRKLDLGTWEKIAEIKPTTDITQITITGLDLQTHKEYELIGFIKNPLTEYVRVRLYFNGDLTDAN